MTSSLNRAPSLWKSCLSPCHWCSHGSLRFRLHFFRMPTSGLDQCVRHVFCMPALLLTIPSLTTRKLNNPYDLWNGMELTWICFRIPDTKGQVPVWGCSWHQLQDNVWLLLVTLATIRWRCQGPTKLKTETWVQKLAVECWLQKECTFITLWICRQRQFC